jgi:hypothetical protein
MSIHAEPDERSGKRLGARLACAQRHKKARSAERALISWWSEGDLNNRCALTGLRLCTSRLRAPQIFRKTCHRHVFGAENPFSGFKSSMSPWNLKSRPKGRLPKFMVVRGGLEQSLRPYGLALVYVALTRSSDFPQSVPQARF